MLRILSSTVVSHLLEVRDLDNRFASSLHKHNPRTTRTYRVLG